MSERLSDADKAIARETCERVIAEAEELAKGLESAWEKIKSLMEPFVRVQLSRKQMVRLIGRDRMPALEAALMRLQGAIDAVAHG